MVANNVELLTNISSHLFIWSESHPSTAVHMAISVLVSTTSGDTVVLKVEMEKMCKIN